MLYCDTVERDNHDVVYGGESFDDLESERVFVDVTCARERRAWEERHHHDDGEDGC